MSNNDFTFGNLRETFAENAGLRPLVRVSGMGTRPFYMSEGAAGADVCSNESVMLYRGQRKLITTGLFLEIPPGYEVQVRPRSGLALKYGVTVLNAPGTIDSDYRGELGVLLINHGENTFFIEPGDRIAQIVVAQVCRAKFENVDELNQTERGGGGFGSTGV